MSRKWYKSPKMPKSEKITCCRPFECSYLSPQKWFGDVESSRMQGQPKYFKKFLLQAPNLRFSMVFVSRTHPLLSLTVFLFSLLFLQHQNSQLSWFQNAKSPPKSPLFSLLPLHLRTYTHSLSPRSKTLLHTPPAAPLCQTLSPTPLFLILHVRVG